jgi:hypothetical protein
MEKATVYRFAVENRARPLFATAIATLSLVLSGCGIFGLSTEQRAAAIELGDSLSSYGQLLAEETSYIRSEVKQLRVLEVSLPAPRSAQLFDERKYAMLGEGLDQKRLERLVQLGGAAEKFGIRLARTADITSSTAEEKLFFTASHNFVLIAGSVAEAAAGVSIGAPAVNLVTMLSTDAYRRRAITRTLTESRPAVRGAVAHLAHEFDPDDRTSLLFVYSQATARLGNLLESSAPSFRSANLTAEDREIVANAFRSVARNRLHIQYVTSRQKQLSNEAGAAYEALLAELNREEARLSDIDAFSEDAARTKLALETLR